MYQHVVWNNIELLYSILTIIDMRGSQKVMSPVQFNRLRNYIISEILPGFSLGTPLEICC